MRKLFLFLSIALFSLLPAKADVISLSSAEGITFLYTKDFQAKALPLLTLQCGDTKPVGNPTHTEVEYTMLTGKRKHCSNSYVESKYLLTDGDTLTVRRYTDGFAWKKIGASKIELIDPQHSWLQKWTDCYEEFFPKDRQQNAGDRYGYPALFEYKDGIFGLLTESGITTDEAGVSMHALGDNIFDLKPDGPENGAWQTFIVGNLSDIVESTLVTDIAAPSLLKDTSWIKPGVASWIYWANNHGSNDFNIIKKYVDMAAQLDLPYVLIDAEWDEMKDGKTIDDAVNYAHSKGVNPMIWYNSSIGWVNGAPGPKYRLNTPEDLEKEFAWCQKLGIKGVKIDFFSGDTNVNWKFMDELLQAAARHHLLVNFHGAPLPRGWQRTYPNLITTEAVYGAEWYNNLPVLTKKAAAHNATLPFTRNVIGSMDYTPCAFTDSQHPHITTHAHELALTALYESGIQHLADRPESFLAQPEEVKVYLANLPTVWDDTVLLGGYPGEYVVLARKKGNKWYIAAINGTDIPVYIANVDYSRLNLSNSDWTFQLFEDADPVGTDPNAPSSNTSNPWKITTPNSLPTTFHLLPQGGILMTATAK